MPNLPALLAGGDFLIALTITADGKTPNGAIGTGPFQLTGFNNGVLTLDRKRELLAGTAICSMRSRFACIGRSATSGSI